jgi:DHA1 family bicyclomycin/chloramphenicol resistance-like MFS transporter
VNKSAMLPSPSHADAARTPATTPNSLWTLVILCALMAFASISTDIYLPAMPTMEGALHATSGNVELTVSGYLVGFASGQLFWGPLSDRWGRKLPIAIGLVFFIIGSTGCAMSGSIHALIAWRVVQAVGACASVTLGRAIVRDLYAGNRAAQMMSTLMVVAAIAPLVGPSLGGFILLWTGWRAIFWVLVAVGLATLAAVFTLPETLPVERRVHKPLARVFADYGSLLKHPRLWGYAGIGGFFYGGIYAYVAGTPFAYITYHHVAPQHYGLLFALSSMGIMVTNLLNARFVSRYGSDRIMRVGAVAACVMGTLVAVAAWTDWGGLMGLVIPLFLFISCVGFIAANAITGALSLVPQRAGSVSALIGASQYGMGIFGSALVGVISTGTPWPMGAAIALFGIGTLLCAWLLVPPVANE